MPRRFHTFLLLVLCCLTAAWLPGAPAAGTAAKGGERPLKHVKILAINDLHGRIGNEPSGEIAGQAVGGGPFLAARLREAMSGAEDRTVIVSAGDLVGASPALSALLDETPAVAFLNLLANRHCRGLDRSGPRCNVVATVGNHEFDRGLSALLRLLRGGADEKFPPVEKPWRGARFPVVCSNVVQEASGRSLFRPYAVCEIDGVPVAFVGAVTKSTPIEVVGGRVKGLSFLDEAESVNKVVADLKRKKIRSVVVLLHQGGSQAPYDGPTDASRPGLTGDDVLSIVNRLDPEVDVVVSAHLHKFSNALVPNAGKRPVLVTQANSYGKSFAEIDLAIDPVTRDVAAKTAAIRPVLGAGRAGAASDGPANDLARKAADAVRPMTSRRVGRLAGKPLARQASCAGVSAIGAFVADAHRFVGRSEVAFTNPTGLRSDLDRPDITWGDLLNVVPFRNDLFNLDLTGDEIRQVLQLQWGGARWCEFLQVSGLRYTWKDTPQGKRIDILEIAGAPFDGDRLYVVTVAEFLALGGNGFDVFKEKGRNRRPVVDGNGEIVKDIDSLVAYIEGPLGGVVPVPADYERRAVASGADGAMRH